MWCSLKINAYLRCADAVKGKKKGLAYLNSAQGWMTVKQLHTGFKRLLKNTFFRTQNRYETSFKKQLLENDVIVFHSSGVIGSCYTIYSITQRKIILKLLLFSYS